MRMGFQQGRTSLQGRIRPDRRRRIYAPQLECLEPLLCPTVTLNSEAVLVFDPQGTAQVIASLSHSGEDIYRLDLPAAGRLLARGAAREGSALDPRLTLLGPQGNLLVQAHDVSETDASAEIALHLPPGTYSLRLSAETETHGAYSLIAHFETAIPPFDPLPLPVSPFGLATTDLDGDGNLDLVAAIRDRRGLTLFHGLGDGSFQPGEFHSVGAAVEWVTIGDIDDDGRPDLITANGTDGSVTVLHNQGDGAYPIAHHLEGLGESVRFVIATDFDGDGQLDLAVADAAGREVRILRRQIDGSFRTPESLEAGQGPRALAVDDFNRDQHPDLAVVSQDDGMVHLFLNRGDGSFLRQAGASLVTSDAPQPTPFSLTTGDFDQDGRPDLAVVNKDANSLTILRTTENLSLLLSAHSPVGTAPEMVAAADFDGDGWLDLAVANTGGETVSFLVGQVGGVFRVGEELRVGLGPQALSLGDWDRDGRLDVATALSVDKVVAVRRGVGDGTFLSPQTSVSSRNPQSLAVADFDRDGQTDVVIGDRDERTLRVALGRGDGTLRSPLTIASDVSPRDVAVADFNRDGRPDLALAEEAGRIAVFLGLGDGHFLDPLVLDLAGARLLSLATEDWNNDDITDLLILIDNPTHGPGVNLARGRGDGTFVLAAFHPLAAVPFDLAVGDLDGDGLSDDFAVTVPIADTASLFLRQEDGTYVERRVAVGPNARALAIADLDGDRRKDDLIVASTAGTGSLVLRRDAASSLATSESLPTGGVAQTLAIHDHDGDGHVDLVVGLREGPIRLLRGNGLGGFAAATTLVQAGQPQVLVSAQLNEGTTTDLVVADGASRSVDLYLNPGNDTLILSGEDRGVDRRHTPIRVDVDGDGRLDALILNRRGELLLRRGQADGSLTPPVLLNSATQYPGRELASLTTVSGPAVALTAADGDRVIVHHFSPAGARTEIVSLRSLSLSEGELLPARIAAADLNGDGRADLVTANAVGNSVSVLFQNAEGSFAGSPQTVRVGIAPSDLLLRDIDGRFGPDVVVTHPPSGEVRILFNDRDHLFASDLRFRASPGPYGLADDDATLVRALAQTVNAAAADVTGEGAVDLVLLNRAERRLVLLTGDGAGAFANPVELPMPLSTGAIPAIRPGHLKATDVTDDGHADLLLLLEDRGEVLLARGKGNGTFDDPIYSPAGNGPRGLTIIDANGDLFPDLLLGNEFGDLLTLLGDGRGRFVYDRRGLQAVPLAIADREGDGQADDVDGDGEGDILVARQAQDDIFLRSVSDAQRGDQGTLQAVDTDNAELLAPGAMTLTELDGDGFADLIVASSGQNHVLVYRGKVEGGFAEPESYETGFNPTGVAVQDLTADGIPDLVVANRGSNDLSVLIGRRTTDTSWTADPGPRLTTGGLGPNRVTVRDETGDGILDLIVNNQESGTLSLLPGIGFEGRGSGFFNDTAVQTLVQGLSTTAPSVISPDGGGFAPGAAGGVLGISPGFILTPLPVLADRQVQRVALAGGDGDSSSAFVAAFSGGVALVTLGADGNVRAISEQLSRALDLPSELTVLRRETELDVFATGEGGDIFFFRFSLVPPTIEPQAPTPDRTLTNALTGGPALALIVTLTPGYVIDAVPEPPSTMSVTADVQPPALEQAESGGSAEDEAEAEESEAAPDSERGERERAIESLELDEALRRLLQKTTDPLTPIGDPQTPHNPDAHPRENQGPVLPSDTTSEEPCDSVDSPGVEQPDAAREALERYNLSYVPWLLAPLAICQFRHRTRRKPPE